MSGEKTVTIQLGGRSFSLRPLTLRQLRTALPLLGKVLPAFGLIHAAEDDAQRGDRVLEFVAGGHLDECLEIIAAAVSRVDPDINIEQLLDTESINGIEIFGELFTAVMAIGDLSGLIRKNGPAASGEAKAASI